MSYLLFFIYLVLASFFIPRTPFAQKTGLSYKALLLFFLAKIAAAVVLAFVTHKFYPGNDYEGLNFYGQEEYKLLMSNPWTFFTSSYSVMHSINDGSWLSSTGSFWNDLENTLLSKVLAIFNIFSRGNYYINSLFFNCIGFFAHLSLFRMFSNIYPGRKMILIIGCFLIPSTLYFSSGLHKDAIVFTAMALYFYSLYFLVYEKISSRKILLLVFSFIIILLLRNFVSLILFPLTMLFMFTEKFKWKPVYAFGVFFMLAIIFIMFLPLLGINPLKLIIDQRKAFEDLGYANTALPPMQLQASFKSIITHLPEAFANVFLRPFPWVLKPLWLLPFVLEMLVIFLIIGYSFFQPPGRRLDQPFILLLVIFAFTMLLIIGYIVPNSGSIVRYRSLYLPFLLVPFLATIQKRIIF
ncbi:MAG: hypothetical protein ABIW38_08550 [Ferruginibacter sp.]